MKDIAIGAEAAISPETPSLDHLLNEAIRLAQTVEAYKARRVDSTGIPFRWGNDDVEMSVWFDATYHEDTAGQTLITDETEAKRAAHRFIVTLGIEEAELDSLPQEVIDKAQQEKLGLDATNLRTINYDYDLTIQFSAGDISWEENTIYYVTTEENTTTRIKIEVPRDRYGEIYEPIQPENKADRADAANGLDELEILFGGAIGVMEREAQERRTAERIEQAFMIMGAVDRRRVIEDLSFAGL